MEIFITNSRPTFDKDCKSMSSATMGQVRLIPLMPSLRFDAHNSFSTSLIKQRIRKGERTPPCLVPREILRVTL